MAGGSGYGSFRAVGWSGRAFKGAPAGSAGLYPKKGSDWGQRGGRQYPTLEEAIRRNSQWSRWRKGLGLYWQSVRSGGLGVDPALAPFRTTGLLEPRSLVGLTAVSSRGERQVSWSVATRVRGSILGLAPLGPGDLELDTRAENPEDWRLWYKPPGNAAVVSEQLRFLQHMIGDLFEDSATPKGPGDEVYWQQLTPRDTEAVKLQLEEVDLAGSRLGFRINRWRYYRKGGPGALWEADGQTEDRSKLPMWRLGQVVCSSAKFNCGCPDFLGRVYADLTGEHSGLSVEHRFPLPAGTREVGKEQPGARGKATNESVLAGIYKQWRAVNRNRLDTIECKHIHAARWAYGCPREEPKDMPTGDIGFEQRRALEEELSDVLYGTRKAAALDPYQGSTPLTDERAQSAAYTKNDVGSFGAAVALAVGILVECPTDAYGNVRPFSEWGYRSMLWEPQAEPPPYWCRQNDWWSPRGQDEIYRFDVDTNGFGLPNGEPRIGFARYKDWDVAATGLQPMIQRWKADATFRENMKAVVVP